jgi:hypothetical protein
LRTSFVMLPAAPDNEPFWTSLVMTALAMDAAREAMLLCREAVRSLAGAGAVCPLWFWSGALLVLAPDTDSGEFISPAACADGARTTVPVKVSSAPIPVPNADLIRISFISPSLVL